MPCSWPALLPGPRPWRVPRIGRLALLALLLAAWVGSSAAHDGAALKAAIVFNLLQFVQWPEETPGAQGSSGAPLFLCADRAGALWPHLEALQARAQRSPRPLLLRELPTTPEGVRTCHAWLAEAVPGARRAPPPPTPGQPLLVIADVERADEAGVTIGLRHIGERLAFDVDLATARRCGLQISSKLLRLAERVNQ